MFVGCIEDVTFGVSSAFIQTIRNLGLNSSARYEDHQVLGAFPRPEYLAPELRTATIPMTLRADAGADPASVVRQLEEYCEDGKVVMLMIGNENLGLWTVRKVSRTWTRIHPDASGPIALEGSVELTEYF